MPDAYLLMPDAYPLVPDAYPLMPDAYPLVPDAYPLVPDAYPLMPDAYPLMPASPHTCHTYSPRFSSGSSIHLPPCRWLSAEAKQISVAWCATSMLLSVGRPVS